MQFAQMLADHFHIGLARSNFSGATRLKQRPDFLVQVACQCLKLFLTQAAFRFQALPLAGLRQAVAAAAQQLSGTAEEAAVGEDLLQRRVSPFHTAILQFTGPKVALFDFILRQQQLPTITGLFQQQ